MYLKVALFIVKVDYLSQKQPFYSTKIFPKIRLKNKPTQNQLNGHTPTIAVGALAKTCRAEGVESGEIINANFFERLSRSRDQCFAD